MNKQILKFPEKDQKKQKNKTCTQKYRPAVSHLGSLARRRRCAAAPLFSLLRRRQICPESPIPGFGAIAFAFSSQVAE
jgi:hypothetical protein